MRAQTVEAVPIAVTDPYVPPRAYRWLRARLAQPRAVFGVTVLAFVMSLPAVATGLVTDDYMFESAVARDPTGVFVFRSLDPEQRRASIHADRAAGTTPWWIDENFQQAFLRPLSSLSHALDYRLWPRAVWLMHVENSLWFAAIVWLAGAIFRQLAFTPAALGFGAFFYATRGNCATSVAWLAARNTLLASCFGLLAIFLQLRARGHLGLRLAAACSLALGLASAEFAAGALGFLVADALILQHGTPARRLRSLWPYALVIGIWLAVYVRGGYGVVGSGFYRNPASAPGAILLGLLTNVPIYFATQFTWPFATFSCFFPGALAIVTGLSVVILYLLRGMFWPLLRSDARARFLALGAALSTVPLAATPAQDRLVFMVALGCAGFLALLLTQRLDAPDGPRPAHLLRIHAVYLPMLFVPMLFSTASANAVGGGTEALADALPRQAHALVVLNTPSELQAYFQPAIRQHRGLPSLPPVDVLYAGTQPVKVRRSSDRALDLEVENGYFAATLERIVRDPAQTPFHAGDTIDLARMRVRVLKVNPSGAPTLVRFEFPDALEHLDIDWLVWRDRTPQPWQPPPIGAQLSLEALRAFP